MTDEVTSERLLYAPTRRFLHVSFVQRLKEQSSIGDLQIYAADTSVTPGGDGGQWTRPDIAALVLGRGKFVPYWRADLHTFEVKTASGVTETSVHEANAQGRFGHYPWLVFQAVGRATISADGIYARLRKLASHLGVGMINFINPEKPQDWQIALWPRRTGADDQIADNFVRERFPAETKEQISGHLASLGWTGDDRAN